MHQFQPTRQWRHFVPDRAADADGPSQTIAVRSHPTRIFPAMGSHAKTQIAPRHEIGCFNSRWTIHATCCQSALVGRRIGVVAEMQDETVVAELFWHELQFVTWAGEGGEGLGKKVSEEVGRPVLRANTATPFRGWRHVTSGEQLQAELYYAAESSLSGDTVKTNTRAPLSQSANDDALVSRASISPYGDFSRAAKPIRQYPKKENVSGVLSQCHFSKIDSPLLVLAKHRWLYLHWPCQEIGWRHQQVSWARSYFTVVYLISSSWSFRLLGAPLWAA